MQETRGSGRPAVTILAIFALALPVLAATYTVDDDGAADFNSIQAAINAASNFDTILVRPGRYYETLSFQGKQLTVVSEKGPEVTTVFLEQQTRIVLLDGDSTLSGFTITGGRARVGAGIRITGGASPVVENNHIVDNEAARDGFGLALGGGIAVEDGSAPTIRNNIIRGNRSLGDGAGEYGYGGGIDLGDGTTATIVNNVIAENAATDSGGGISLGLAGEATPVVITNNTIVGNRAGGEIPNGFSFGGGVSVYSDAVVTLRNNAITGNASAFEGGGVYFFANNLNRVTYESNDYDGNTPDDCAGVSSNSCSGGQHFLPPLYFDEAGGDYRLRSDSPLVDLATGTGAPAEDRLGRSRPVDGDLDAVSAPDIGAYENQGELTRLRWDDESTLSWDGSENPSMVYDLYRDLLSALAPGPLGLCRQSGLATPTAIEAGTPPAGEGWFYLPGGRDVEVGSLGFSSGGLSRVPADPCP